MNAFLLGWLVKGNPLAGWYTSLHRVFQGASAVERRARHCRGIRFGPHRVTGSMETNLSATQARILRRCSGGLRVWESGEDLARLKAELDILQALGLVSFDETEGHETTARGEAWLVGDDG